MNYKEGDLVVLHNNYGKFIVGIVISTQGMYPYNLVVEDSAHWCYSFDESGNELDRTCEIRPLTKLHKILLGIK